MRARMQVPQPPTEELLKDGREIMENIRRKLPTHTFALVEGPFDNGNLAAIGFWSGEHARWRPCMVLVPAVALARDATCPARWLVYEHELFIDGKPALGDIPWPEPPAFDPCI